MFVKRYEYKFDKSNLYSLICKYIKIILYFTFWDRGD